MPGSTDREEGLTNRDIDLHNLVKVEQFIKSTM